MLQEENTELREQMEAYKVALQKEKLATTQTKTVMEKQIGIINKQLSNTREFYEEKIEGMKKSSE